MLTNMKKMKINGKMCDVASLEEYIANKDAYIQGSTVIEVDGYGLPISSKNDNKPGISIGSAFSHYRLPSEEEKSEYLLENAIDMSNVHDIGELMMKQEAVRDLEKEILTDPDNIFIPVINEDDSPAMKAVKEAIIEKHIDFDKYGHRFGANLNNDKRVVSKKDKKKISLPMIERLCTNLDIKASLVLEDASPDVPNPIGRTITVELTGKGEDD